MYSGGECPGARRREPFWSAAFLPGFSGTLKNGHDDNMLMGKDMIQKMGFGWIFWSSILFWHSFSQNRQKIMFWLNDQTSRVSNPKVHMTSIITAQLGLCREEFSSSLSRWRAKGEGPWMIPCQWFYTESILQNQPHRGYPSGIKRGRGKSMKISPSI